MTTKPIITLANVKLHVGLSEETPCYTATVLVDGKKFADVSNHGHGGCDMVSASHTAVAELNARIAATYPQINLYDDVMADQDFETLCHTLVWEFADQRNFRSSLSRKVLARRPDGNIVDFKGKKTDALLAAVRKKEGYTVLNDLSFDEAWAMFKAAPSNQ